MRLRRAANGVVKILAESEVALPMTLSEVAEAATKDETSTAKVEVFLCGAAGVLSARGEGAGVRRGEGGAGGGSDDVRDAVARAEAVTAVRGSEDFAAVSAAFKRMKNILAQAKEKGIAAGSNVDAALLTEPTEKALAERSAELASECCYAAFREELSDGAGADRDAETAGGCVLRCSDGDGSGCGGAGEPIGSAGQGVRGLLRHR